MNYIIPAGLTFLFGLLLWLIKRDRLLLVYDLTESDIFPSNLRNGKYFIIKVKNKGNKAIEDSMVKFSFPKGDIHKYSNSDINLITNETVSLSEYCCKIPLLNPKETIQFTITTESDTTFESPNIHIRGKGINGQIETSTDYSIISSIIAPLIISIIIGLFGTTIIQNLFFKDESGKKEILEQIADVKSTLKVDSVNSKLNKLSAKTDQLDSLIALEEKGNPDREDIIFIVFNKSGLTDLFPNFIETVSETTFKNTAFFLFHNYLIDSKRKENYIKALNSLGETKNMAATSNGTIYYLLYKIYTEENERNKAMTALKECELIAPLLYESFIQNDKYYDIKSLRNKLKIKE